MRPFDFTDTDHTLSFYYRLEDIFALFETWIENFNREEFRRNYNDSIIEVQHCEVIQELHNTFFPKPPYCKSIYEIFNEHNNRRYQKRLSFDSFDEIVLYRIFTDYPDLNVTLHYRLNGLEYDFLIERNGQRILIDFFGIGHFKPGRFNQNLAYPLDRLDNFRNNDFELIIWPYWIQRCVKNLKVILGEELHGLGAIWSSDFHFGDFQWQNSNIIITQLNASFNIERNNSIGYIYGPNYEERDMIENPVIVQKILNHRARTWTNDKLIPNGTPDAGRNYWLPYRLRE